MRGEAPHLAPPSATPAGRPPLIGRQPELAVLLDDLAEAAAGRRRIALVSGDPGIGKSRLALELQERGRAGGCTVAVGRCLLDEGMPTLWPWAQVLRRLVSAEHGATVLRGLGSAASLIGQAVPAVAGLLDGCPPPPPMGPEAARFRLLEGITEFLARIAARCPLLVVVEDVHWADPPSLQLLEFLAAELSDTPLFVVATYRDAEVRAGDPLARTLAALAVADGVRRLGLGGLATPDVARYIAVLTGGIPDDALVATVAERTDGNPFFVGEVVRLLARDGLGEAGTVRLAGRVPAEVRAAVEGRLSRLSPDAQHVLAAAAVAGREFDIAVLEQVAGVEPPALVAALHAATADRLVVAGGGGVHHFAHALVRETLLERMAPLDRARLHGAVGDALESTGALAGRPPTAGEIAHHRVEAAIPGGTERIERAVAASVAAAAEATARLAFEDAVAHQAVALRLAVRAGWPETRQAPLLLALGEAQNRSGDTLAARAGLLAATRMARRAGDAVLLGRAVLGYRLGPGTGWEYTDPDREHVELLEEAIEAIGDSEDGLRAGLLARLAIELAFGDDAARRTSVGEAAIETARRSGDRRVLVEALIAVHLALWSPATLDRQLDLAREAVRRAVDLGDRELELQARYWLCVDLAERGDLAGLGAQCAAVDRFAGELRMPIYGWWSRLRAAMLALLDGRVGDAEVLAAEALGMGSPVKEGNALQVYGAQLLVIRWEQGRLAEVEAVVGDTAARFPSSPVWRCADVFVAAALGDTERAHAGLRDLLPDGAPAWRGDSMWWPCAALLGEAAVESGDPVAAAALARALTPYRDRWISTGPAAVIFGPVARLLAELHVVAGDLAAAGPLVDAALAATRGDGVRLARAHAEVARARLGAARGLPGDAEAGRSAARAARAIAMPLGMRALAERAERLAAAADRGADALTRREREVLELARRGDAVRVIAERLHIGERTVESHLASIYRKLGVRSRVEMLGRADLG